tara:strand:- start:146 stop:373 length:228 start_codon:yes stop_codon:yes gene_type:complete
MIHTDSDTITIEWCTDDVKEHCKWLSDEQAVEVLYSVHNNHDCNIGITWDVIFYTAQAMYPLDQNINNLMANMSK